MGLSMFYNREKLESELKSIDKEFEVFEEKERFLIKNGNKKLAVSNKIEIDLNFIKNYFTDYNLNNNVDGSTIKSTNNVTNPNIDLFPNVNPIKTPLDDFSDDSYKPSSMVIGENDPMFKRKFKPKSKKKEVPPLARFDPMVPGEERKVKDPRPDHFRKPDGDSSDDFL